MCGVSERTISQLKNVVIPAVPSRIGGVVKIDPLASGAAHSDQRKRQLYRPVMEESRGWDQLTDAKPVGLSWAVSASYGQTATATATTAAAIVAKPKKGAPSTLQASGDRLREALLQQHESRINRCMRRIESTDALRETQFALVSEHTVSSRNDIHNAVAALTLDSEGEDDGQRGRADRGDEKDAYLYGLSHYAKKKKVSTRKRGVWLI